MRDIGAARAILERLIAFPTVSSESNLDLIDWVEDYLAGHGVAAHRVYNAEGTKANLYASVGPAVPGGVVLSGHTDVVPVAGQDWSSDPFMLCERDGRLYGRGTCDMKGFDALALAAVPMALRAGVKRPLQIALSYDEEIACEGCVSMVAEMAARLPRASAVIVGEPSRMKVVTGHKGTSGFTVHVRGHEVHSAMMHRGVNAIMEAARLIDWANAQNARVAAAVPGVLAAAFDPPWTTTHVGLIEGGTACNITAGDCRFGIDFRVVPGETTAEWDGAFSEFAAAVEAGMKAVAPDAGITLKRDFNVPPLVPETTGAAESLARRLTGDNAVSVVSYATEAGQFQSHGYSAVVCGPGDIAQAHQADEYIEMSEFAAGMAFMERLVEDLAR
ncbi:MAG: acetylornithine deacetylase [Rhodobacteraceae bacterium]|nr:acetylornithine deacetylase [Paracoccaceae bacterium]